MPTQARREGPAGRCRGQDLVDTGNSQLSILGGTDFFPPLQIPRALRQGEKTDTEKTPGGVGACRLQDGMCLGSGALTLVFPKKTTDA